MVRGKYWRGLFENPEFVQNLTSNLRKELMSRVDKLIEYEFSFHNIIEMRIELNKKTVQSIEDTIIKLFDDLSQKYTYYDETSKNIHYFNGWKTNKAHKINKKVIMPYFETVDSYNKWEFRYTGRNKLKDIEKCLAFLDGGETPDIDMDYILDKAERTQNPRNIELKYFNVTFYKKGTCHLTFTNDKLLDKFNIFGCQRKRWLPPCYGKKKYTDMTADEKTVVESFGVDYGKVINDTKYYIIESSQFLLSTSESDVIEETSTESGTSETIVITADANECDDEPIVLAETTESNENDNTYIQKTEKTNPNLKNVDWSEIYEQLTIA